MNTLKTIGRITYDILFGILILVSILLILTSFNIIKGYSSYVVMSGSMEPSIKTGSVIGSKLQDKYEINDVITVKPNQEITETYTHRIVETGLNEQEQLVYYTKGDANETKDPLPAPQDKILGKTFVQIPYLGYVIDFAKRPLGIILMIGIPAVIIVSMEISNIRKELENMSKNKENKKK